MNSLNQPERRARLWQFSLLYLLALVIPLGASYYLFSNSSIADENARLRAELDRTRQEQTQLVTRFDTLTQRLQHTIAIDLQMSKTKQDDLLELGKYTTQNQDNMAAIVNTLSKLKEDSAGMTVPAHRQLASNLLRDFTLFRSNRGTIDLMQQELNRSGDAAKGNVALAAELSQVKQENVMLKAIANSRPAVPASAPAAAAAAPAPHPKPSSQGAAAPSVSTLLKIEELKDKVAFAEADCMRQRGLDFKAGSRERKQLLEQSRTALLQVREDASTAEMKQNVEKALESINVELGRPARFFGVF